jgi:hypothetical protein
MRPMRTLFKKLYYIRYVADDEDKYCLTHTRDPITHIRYLESKHRVFKLRHIKVV